jgi:hypothetical protein
MKLTHREKLTVKMLTNSVVPLRGKVPQDHYHGLLAFIRLVVKTMKAAGCITRGNRRMANLFRTIDRHTAARDINHPRSTIN